MKTLVKIAIMFALTLIVIGVILFQNQQRYLALTKNEGYTIGIVYAVTQGSHGARYADYNFKVQKQTQPFKGTQTLIGEEETFIKQVKGKPFLVIYNKDKPSTNTMIFDYPMDLSSYKLGVSLDNIIDKNKIIIDRWRI